MITQQNKNQHRTQKGKHPSIRRLLALCRSISILFGLAASYRPTREDLQKALQGLIDLLTDHNIQMEGHAGDVVPFDPKIHYCNKKPEKSVRIITPAFVLVTAQHKVLLRKAFVHPAVETALVPFYFDVICEGCFEGSYPYTGSHRQLLDFVVAMQAHLRVQCPTCGQPAGCRLPYSPGPNFDLQKDPLALVEPAEVEPGALVVVRRRDGKFRTLAG